MGGYSMRPRANINMTEDAVTEAIVDYCNLRGIPIAHVPNEGKRSLQYGARLKKMGMQKLISLSTLQILFQKNIILKTVIQYLI